MVRLLFQHACCAQNWLIWLYPVGISCGNLTVLSNGRVDTSAGISFGDTAMYSCDTGYMLSGPAERTCQADGQWNGSVPTCESEWTSYVSVTLLHQIVPFTSFSRQLVTTGVCCMCLDEFEGTS